MNRKLLVLGSVLGFFAVILGAFGAHGLEKILDVDSLSTFEVGVRYQFYHALLALVVGGFHFFSKKGQNFIFYFLLIGCVLFSGSIYLLSTNDLTSFDFRVIALLTPLGGLFLIAAWAVLIINCWNLKISLK